MNKSVDAPIRHTHITSERRWFDLNLKELWQYRDLIKMFVKKDFSLIYKQTILGPLWLIINPLLTSFVYVVLLSIQLYLVTSLICLLMVFRSFCST